MQRIDFQVTQYLTLLQGQAEHGRELDLFGQALGGWLRFAGTTIPPALAKNVLALENSFPESEYTRLARQLFDKAGGTVQTYVDQELQHVRELAAQKNSYLPRKFLTRCCRELNQNRYFSGLKKPRTR